MSKVAIVYWSGTGNIQVIVEYVANGVKSVNAEADVFTSAEFTTDQMDKYDAIGFVCPSMGVKQLEETKIEPMFLDCEAK